MTYNVDLYLKYETMTLSNQPLIRDKKSHPNSYNKGLLMGILLLLGVMIAPEVKGQIVISLLFGDALNTPKIEFGLIGGVNRSNFLEIEDAEALSTYNLGFYFHINVKNNSFISTGVLVKSNVGASGMPVYPIGDDDFDGVFQDAILTTKVNYFYVPILLQQRFNNRWYLEGGIQAGLRSKAYDDFDKDYNEGKLNYELDVRDQYARLDFGLMAGVGYKTKKILKSMSIGINYYYGLVDVYKDPNITKKNSYVNIFFKLPIGLGKDPDKPKE